MKRTLSILTAAIFAGAIAVPAFAQGGAGAPEASPATEASPAAEASPAMSQKPHKHRHHKKKGEESGESSSGTTEPSGGPSDSNPH